jgi:hypothetical protein
MLIPFGDGGVLKGILGVLDGYLYLLILQTLAEALECQITHTPYSKVTFNGSDVQGLVLYNVAACYSASCALYDYLSPTGRESRMHSPFGSLVDELNPVSGKHLYQGTTHLPYIASRLA